MTSVADKKTDPVFNHVKTIAMMVTDANQELKVCKSVAIKIYNENRRLKALIEQKDERIRQLTNMQQTQNATKEAKTIKSKSNIVKKIRRSLSAGRVEHKRVQFDATLEIDDNI